MSNGQSGTELVRAVDIQFGEDVIRVIPGSGSRDYSVILRPTCENMGVSYSPQLRRLKREHWACVTVVVTHDSSGRLQDAATIDRETFKFWLARFTTSRIKNPEVRAKIKRYQLKAMAVIDKNFDDNLEQIVPESQSSPSVGGLFTTAIRQLCDLCDGLDRRISVLEEAHRATLAVAASPVAIAEPVATVPFPSGDREPNAAFYKASAFLVTFGKFGRQSPMRIGEIAEAKGGLGWLAWAASGVRPRTRYLGAFRQAVKAFIAEPTVARHIATL